MTQDEVVFATTCDTDIHAIPGKLDMVQMKVSRNNWIETIDHRLVRTSNIVSIWTPSQEDLENYSFE